MLLLLIACAPPAETPERALDSSGATPPPVHAAPSLDADGVADAIDAVLALGLPSPLAPVTLWEEMLAQGDADCPPSDAPPGSLAMEVPCTASTGYSYQGYGSGSADAMDFDGDGDADRYLLSFRAEGSIIDPQGETFRFGAEARFDQFIGADGISAYTGELLGSLAYPPDDAAWLADGVSSALLIGGVERSDGWGMHLDGGYTVGATSIAFVGFSVYERCPQGPAGTVGLRGEEGVWYDLTLDEGTCDGCGEVTFDGTVALGRACATLTPAFDAAWAALMAARDEAGSAL